MPTNGTWTDLCVPSAGGQAKVITAGFDANLWFTEPAVEADYNCSGDAGGSGVAECTGSAARHAAIDTSRVGPASLTVTTHDLAGNATTSTRNYTVAAAATPTPTPIATPTATPAPTATPVVVGPQKRPKVHADLAWDYKSKGHFTWFTNLRLSNVTKGAKLTVSCKGGGCPRGKLTLARMLNKKLRKGAVLELRFTKRGATGLRIALEMRKAGRRPLVGEKAL
jgi:hypothetical protein